MTYPMFEDDAGNHRKLWASVLLEGIRCACGFVSNPSNGYADIVKEAQLWLDEPDFDEVCAHANINAADARSFVSEVRTHADPEARLREILHDCLRDDRCR